MAFLFSYTIARNIMAYNTYRTLASLDRVHSGSPDNESSEYLQVKEQNTDNLLDTFFNSPDVAALTALDEVEATGASDDINFVGYDSIVFHVVSSGVTDGATIKVQSSLDGTSYADVYELTVDANETNEIIIDNRPAVYYRVNITSYTDGTYTVKYIRK